MPPAAAPDLERPLAGGSQANAPASRPDHRISPPTVPGPRHGVDLVGLPTRAGLYFGPARGAPRLHAGQAQARTGQLVVVLHGPGFAELTPQTLEIVAAQIETDPRVLADPRLRIRLAGAGTASLDADTDTTARALARRLSRPVTGSVHPTWGGARGEFFHAPRETRGGVPRPGHGAGGLVSYRADGSLDPAPPADAVTRGTRDRDLFAWTGGALAPATGSTSTPAPPGAPPRPAARATPPPSPLRRPPTDGPTPATRHAAAGTRYAAAVDQVPPIGPAGSMATLADQALAAAVVRATSIHLPTDPGRSDPAAAAAAARFGATPALTFLAHGRAGGVSFRTEILTAPQIVEVILRSGIWKGQQVDLASCFAAAGPSPLARQVADGLGVEVRAPGRRGFTGRLGLLFDADVTIDPSTGSIVPDLSTATALTTFAPGGDTRTQTPTRAHRDPDSRTPGPRLAGVGAVEVGTVTELHSWMEGISGGAPASAVIGGVGLPDGMHPYRHVGDVEAQGAVDIDSPVAMPGFFVESGAMGHSGLVESIVGRHGTDLREALLDQLLDLLPGASRDQLAPQIAPLGADPTSGGTPAAVWRAELLDGVELHSGQGATAELTLLVSPEARAAARPRPLTHDASPMGSTQKRWQTNIHAAGTVEGIGSEVSGTARLGFAGTIPIAGRFTAAIRLMADIRRGFQTERATTASSTTTSVRRVFGAGRQRAFELDGELRVSVAGRSARAVPVLLTVQFPVEQAANTHRTPQTLAVSDTNTSSSRGSAPASAAERARAGVFAALPVALESIDTALLRRTLKAAVPDVDWTGLVTETHLLGVGDQLPGAGLSLYVTTRTGQRRHVIVALVGLGPLERTPGSRQEVVRLDRRVRLQVVHATRRGADNRVGGRLEGGPMYATDPETRAVRAPAHAEAGYAQDSATGQTFSSGIYRKQYLQSAGQVVQFSGTAVMQVRVLDLDDAGASPVEVIEDARVHLVAARSDAGAVDAFGESAPPAVASGSPVLPPSRLAHGYGSALAVVDGLAGAHEVMPRALEMLSAMRAWTAADLATVRRAWEVTISLGGLSARWEELMTATALHSTVTVDGVEIDVAVAFTHGATQHLGTRENAVVEYEGDQSEYALAPRQWTDTVDGAAGVDVRAAKYAGASASARLEQFREHVTTRGEGTARNSGFTVGGLMHVFGWSGSFRLRVTVRGPEAASGPGRRGVRTETSAPIDGAVRVQVPETFTRTTADPVAGLVTPADPSEVVAHHELDPGTEQVIDVWGTDALHRALAGMLRGLGVDVHGTTRATLGMVLSPEVLRGLFVRMGTARGFTLVLPNAAPDGSDVVVTLRVFAVPSTEGGRRAVGVRPWWEPEVLALSQESRRTGWTRGAEAGITLGRVEVDDTRGDHYLDLDATRGAGTSTSTLELDATNARSGVRHVRSGDNDMIALDTRWHLVAGIAGGPPVVEALHVTHGVDLMRRTPGAAPAPAPGAGTGVISGSARTTAVAPVPGAPDLPGAVEAMLTRYAPGLLSDVWALVPDVDGGQRWTAHRGLDPALYSALTLEQLAPAMPQHLGVGTRLPLAHQPGPVRSTPMYLEVRAARTGPYEHRRTDVDDELMGDRVVLDRAADTAVAERHADRALELGYAHFPDGTGGSSVLPEAGRRLERTVRDDHTPAGRITVDEARPSVAAQVATHAGPVQVTVALVAAPTGRHLLRLLALPSPTALWQALRRITPRAPSVSVPMIETIVAPAVLHPAATLTPGAGNSVTAREPGAAFPPDRAMSSRDVIPLGFRESVLGEYRDHVRSTRMQPGSGSGAAERRMLGTEADSAAALGHLLSSGLLDTKARQGITGGVQASMGVRQGTVSDTAGAARLRLELGNPVFQGWAQGTSEVERFAAREEAVRSAVNETRELTLGVDGVLQVMGAASALPTGMLGGPAGGLELGHSRNARHQQEHSVLRGSSSVEVTSGPYALFRVDVMAHLETRVTSVNRATGRAVDPRAPVGGDAHLTTAQLADAMTVALPAQRARALGLIPPQGWVRTRAGVYLPPPDPADVDAYADVLPRFPGWQTLTVHMTADGAGLDTELGALDPQQAADLLRAAGAGDGPLAVMVRGGRTRDVLGFFGAVGDLLDVPVIAADGRTKVVLGQPLLATDRSGPRMWHLLARGRHPLGYDLMAVTAATAAPGRRAVNWQRLVLVHAIASTRLVGTHRGEHHRNIMLKPAGLAKEQARDAHRLPGYRGVTMLIGWSDGGRVAAQGTLLDGAGLARWIEEQQVPAEHTVVAAVGGFTGGADLHAHAGGRDVVTTFGQWMPRDGDVTSVLADGGEGAWHVHRNGAVEEAGSSLTEALAELGHDVVLAPQEQVTGREATLPASTRGELHPELAPTDRSRLASAAAADIRAGAVPARLTPAEPGGPAAAPHRTHYGAYLPSAGLDDTAVRYAQRLPQYPDWNVVVAGSTAAGLPLLGDRALDAAGVADLLDASGVPPLVPHVLVASHGLDVATEVARRTGRPFVATDGEVEISPDGTVRAFRDGQPVLFQLVRPDGTRTPLRHELGAAMAAHPSIGPDPGPIARALAAEAAAAPLTDPPSEPGWDDDPYALGPTLLDRVAAAVPAALPNRGRAATPQPEEPKEYRPATGPLYSADLLPDAAAARALVPGDRVVSGGASGARDAAALPPGVTVLARILGDPGGEAAVTIAPGQAYTVVSVTADVLDPDLVRVDLVRAGAVAA